MNLWYRYDATDLGTATNKLVATVGLLLSGSIFSPISTKLVLESRTYLIAVNVTISIVYT